MSQTILELGNSLRGCLAVIGIDVDPFPSIRQITTPIRSIRLDLREDEFGNIVDGDGNIVEAIE